MGWLGLNHVSVDYFTKEIIFCLPSKEEFCFCRSKTSRRGMISMVKAARILKKECEGLLAYVFVDHSDEAFLKDIPIISEFVDVFPEDLPTLPPDREVEFIVELAPNTAPISKAPY